jgi:hypothetical protein
LIKIFDFFVLKVEKTDFLLNFNANFIWLKGVMRKMVVYCAQLT